MNNGHLIETGGRQRQIEGGGDVLRLHGRTELPGDNEAREVVQHRGEIVPAPARDLEIGEVSLPELVGGRGLVLELLGRFDDDVGRADDKIVRFQQPINRGPRKLETEAAPQSQAVEVKRGDTTKGLGPCFISRLSLSRLRSCPQRYQSRRRSALLPLFLTAKCPNRRDLPFIVGKRQAITGK